MTIKPFGNQILIKPEIQKQVIVSERELECNYGEVIAVGDDVKTVKVGMKVGYESYGLKELMVGKDKHVFIREDSYFLLCFIEP